MRIAAPPSREKKLPKRPRSANGTAGLDERQIQLKELIENLNERFGTDFKPEDQLFIDHIVESGKADEMLKTRARANTFENFSLSASETVEGLVIDGMDRHQDFVSKFLNEDQFKRVVFEHVVRRIYQEILESEEAAQMDIDGI